MNELETYAVVSQTTKNEITLLTSIAVSLKRIADYLEQGKVEESISNGSYNKDIIDRD